MGPKIPRPPPSSVNCAKDKSRTPRSPDRHWSDGDLSTCESAVTTINAAGGIVIRGRENEEGFWATALAGADDDGGYIMVNGDLIGLRATVPALCEQSSKELRRRDRIRKATGMDDGQ